jgi:hypothetical protein
VLNVGAVKMDLTAETLTRKEKWNTDLNLFAFNSVPMCLCGEVTDFEPNQSVKG